MGELAARAYFVLCLALGGLLRSARYSTARVVDQEGERRVRKRRCFCAPLLIPIGNLLLRLLDAGVRILPQRDWEERERHRYERLYGLAIRVDSDGTLDLPLLGGRTLAALLEDRRIAESVRRSAVAQAAAALAALHRVGFTHGDAMAENVLLDLEAGPARWLDFETVHEGTRASAWCRADDVRALAVTCLLRTARESRAETLAGILEACADEDVTRELAATFASVWRRSLAFHLGQAPLSFGGFREIGHLLQSARRRRCEL